MRIGVIRAGALGDVLLALPAVSALRSTYPQASLEVVGYPEIWAVVGNLVDTIRSIDSSLFASLYSNPVTPSLREWAESLDCLIAWTTREPTGLKPTVAASPFPPPGRHATSWLLQSLEGIMDNPVLPDTPYLELTSDERERGRQILDGLGVGAPIFIHPGAGAAWKRWPIENFGALAESLAKHAGQVVLIEGPADREVIASLASAGQFPILCGVPIRLLAAILSHGALYVGNDSGVTHLASLMGVPSVALFGPTDPASWRPLGPTQVIRACTSQPQRAEHIRVCDDPTCMAQIRVDEVLLACRQQLGG